MLTVNGETIDQAHLDAEFQRIKPQYDKYLAQRNEPANDDRLRGWARETVIERELLRQEAAKLAEAVTDSEPTAPESGCKQGNQHGNLKRLLDTVTKDIPPVTEDEIAASYKENEEHLRIPETVHAAHIVKHTEAGAQNPEAYREMLNVRERIRKGETFEALAAQHSDCSDNAGDLGTFPRGQMVQEFEDIVFALEPETVSDVFQSPFGYHIAKLYKKTEATLPPLEVVKDKLATHLLETRNRETIEAYIDTLKKQATIVDDEA
jgi:peptidyl-prolyl cis-trans isomerase C